MHKTTRILRLVAVIGAIACTLSFLISLGKADMTAAVIFGLAGLFCIANAADTRRCERDEVDR